MATEIPLAQLATPEVIAEAVAKINAIQPDIDATVAWGLHAEAKSIEVAAGAEAAALSKTAAEAAKTAAETAAASVPTGAQLSATIADTVSAATAPLARRRSNTMLLFGDSWEYFNYGDPTNSLRPSPGSRGYASNGNVFLGHRLAIINKGIGGQDTIALLARKQADLIDQAADIKLVGSGTNDISNGRTFNQITQNLAALYDAAALHGELVVGRTIPPRTSADTAQKALRGLVNQWIRGQALTRRGFIVFDVESAVMDPATNDFVAGYSYDGVHLSNAGAIAAGQVFATLLRPIVPSVPVLLPASGAGNLLASNGGAFPGSAAAVPTGWTANGWSQGAPTYSKVVRTDGLPGQWQQLVVPTDSRGFLRCTNLVMSGGAFVSGDTIRAAVEFEVEGLEVAPNAATQALYLTLEYVDGGTTTARYDLEWNATDNENEGNRSRSGVLLTAPLTIPATTPGAQTLSMTLQARCGGTYRFARASMFKA